MRVLIADENMVRRKKLRRMIESVQYEVIGEAKNGLHVYHKYVDSMPDLLVINLNMPLYGGLSTIERILEYHPEAHIMVMALENQNQLLFNALEKGALHYFKLPLQEKAVIKALREIETLKEDRR